jgi:Papain-like cysteine protease AvrRpt2
LNASPSNIQSFALSYNLQLYYPQCWLISGLTDLLKRGPVALMGPIPSLHAIVIGGIEGDGTDGGTQLKIYDPWPPNVGRIYNISYKNLMNQFPMATMYLLQKR